MKAVKYRGDLSFNWPEKVSSPHTTLPSGYDILLDQAGYDLLITDNQASYDQHLLDQAASAAPITKANAFKTVRNKWQDMADTFAANNVLNGITTAEGKVIADNFSQVVYYLNANVPMQAVAELALVTTDASFFTVAVRDTMAADLTAYIVTAFA